MGVFTRITLGELKDMAAKAKGQINRIYLHWSAGNYHQFFSDYHLMIDDDGSIIKSTDDLTEIKSHTWHRNTGAIGLALCCCVNATDYAASKGDFGVQPPTAEMIDGAAKAVAVLCDELGLPIDKTAVMTHAEIATIDGYGPGSGDEETRWDLLYLPDLPGDGEIKNGGDIIRGKAIWWQQEWKEHGFNGD